MNDYTVGTKLFIVDAGSGSRGVNDETVTVIPHEYVRQGCYKEDDGFTVIVNDTGSKWNVLKEGEYVVLDEVKEKSMFEILAERMGVEIGERFKIKGSAPNDTFVIESNGLKYVYDSKLCLVSTDTLTSALNGELTAIKMQWTPDKNSGYYTIIGTGRIVQMYNEDQKITDRAIKNGMCFRNYKQAYDKGIELGWEMEESKFTVNE